VYSETLKLHAALVRLNQRLVLVESCTAGMVAAELGQIPGISNYLCGSLVVYRNDSKAKWLGVSQELLDSPEIGPVSHQVTEALARAALDRTPEATIAAAITGHLGPGSPPNLDGIIYCGTAVRTNACPPNEYSLTVESFQLSNPTPVDPQDIDGRRARQTEAMQRLIDLLIDRLHALG
jgi:nicotinamide-nucleotide amidase